MKFEEIILDDENRENIINHFNLPIRSSVTIPKFLNDLQFLSEIYPDKYLRMVNFVENDYKKCSDLSMKEVLNEISSEIEQNENWNNNIDVSYINDKYENCITSSYKFYDKENDGKHFVSIDLKKANWQSVKSVVDINCSYFDYIEPYTEGLLIPAISKLFRMKITGELSISTVIKYNKLLLDSHLCEILNIIKSQTGVNLSKMIAFYADEAIFEINEKDFIYLNTLNKKQIENDIFNESNVEIHFTTFTIHWLNINRGCVRDYGEIFEVKNISKDILLIIFKIMNSYKLLETDFEKIKLEDSREKFIADLNEKIAPYFGREGSLWKY